MPDGPTGFVRLAVMSDVMAARLAVARLASEGIPARIHGDGLGPYRLTVGDLAATEIWVAEEHLPAARVVMLATEIDGLPDPSVGDRDAGRVPGVVVGGLVLLALVALYRLLGALG